MDVPAFFELFLTAPVLFSLALILFLVVIRSPWLFTRAGGIFVAMLALGALTWILCDARQRALVFDPERLPTLILFLASALATWVWFHQAYQGHKDERSTTAWQGIDKTEFHLGGVLVVLASALAFFLGAPLLPPADPASAPGEEAVPWFLFALYVLRSYFDAWVPAVWLPVLTVLGLVALPYLDIAGEKKEEALEERHDVVNFFLFVWFLLVLLPVITALFGRGLESDITPDLAPPLSETLWGWVLEQPPRFWWLRELPVMLGLGVYFVVLPRQLPRLKPTRALFGRYLKRLGRRRFYLAMVLMELWMLVPLKMYGRWLFEIGYFVYLPELGLRF